MNSQYLQWIIGPNRGNVEPIEMLQDGQTSEDVVILPNGNRLPTSKVGTEFIILPDKSAALSLIDLEIMYPKQAVRKPQQKQRQAQQPQAVDHAALMGIPINAEQPSVQEKPRRQQASTFASDLLSRSKKTLTGVTVDLPVEMPPQKFFDMINETFDDATVSEILDLIIHSIDKAELNTAIKNSILTFYGATHAGQPRTTAAESADNSIG